MNVFKIMNICDFCNRLFNRATNLCQLLYELVSNIYYTVVHAVLALLPCWLVYHPGDISFMRGNSSIGIWIPGVPRRASWVLCSLFPHSSAWTHESPKLFLFPPSEPQQNYSTTVWSNIARWNRSISRRFSRIPFGWRGVVLPLVSRCFRHSQTHTISPKIYISFSLLKSLHF